MVEKYVSYFGAPFKGQHGVTQVDPLSPVIFNVLVYAVLRHWVTIIDGNYQVITLFSLW